MTSPIKLLNGVMGPFSVVDKTCTVPCWCPADELRSRQGVALLQRSCCYFNKHSSCIWGAHLMLCEAMSFTGSSSVY